MILLRRLHSLYALLIFVFTFIVLFPVFIIASFHPRLHFIAYKVDHWWAKVYFPLTLFRTEVVFKGARPDKGPVIYCLNHFSYLDIPSTGLLPKQACFVGKASIKKVPLFGYMFRTLHIAVDRESIKDRVRAYKKYTLAIEQGKSLFIYPEGGIRSKNIPTQASYKDGAFRVAIEQQVPIIPVTLPFNWKILPDGIWTLQSNYIKLVVHEPIHTKGMTLENLTDLKERVYHVIQNQIEVENDLMVTSDELVSAT